MSIICKATIIREIGKSALYSQSAPLGVEDVSLEPPRAGEVLVNSDDRGQITENRSFTEGRG